MSIGAIAIAGAESASAAVAPSGTSLVVEIEFTPEVWTDVTADVDFGLGLTIHIGRSSTFDEIQAATLTLTLYNRTGAYTPDSPVAAHWPNMTEDRRIRVVYTLDDVPSTRFLGRITSIDPTFPGGSLGAAVVTIGAKCQLAALAGTLVRSDVAQFLLGWADLYDLSCELLPLTPDGDAARALINLAPGGADATVHPPSGGQGAIQFSAAPSDVIIDGYASISADDTGVAPVIELAVRSASRTQCGFWFRGSYSLPDGTGREATSYSALMIAYNSINVQQWAVVVRNVNGTTNLEFVAPNFAYVLPLKTSPSDGAWHSIVLWDFGSSLGIYVDGAYAATASGYRHNQVARVVYGGEMYPNAPGKNIAAWHGDIGGIWWTQATVGGTEHHGTVGNQLAWTDRVSELRYATPVLSSYTVYGADERLVGRRQQAGRSALDVLAIIARTIGGGIWTDFAADTVRILAPDAARMPEVALTVALSEDDLDSPTWTRSVESRPTRVTADTPLGSITAIDADAESTGARREESVETVAATLPDGYAVASARLTRSSRMRVSRLTVEPTTAINAATLWPELLALYPGARVRMTGVPSAIFGFTRFDSYAAGWEERWDERGTRFALDLEPADAPIEAEFDDAETGRFAANGTMTLSAALTSSSTSAVVITDASGYPLTTEAGDYPLDLDLTGERVTVSSAPVSSTSPQTVTISRGVSPTVARAHAAGEQVEIWHAASFAY